MYIRVLVRYPPRERARDRHLRKPRQLDRDTVSNQSTYGVSSGHIAAIDRHLAWLTVHGITTRGCRAGKASHRTQQYVKIPYGMRVSRQQ